MKFYKKSLFVLSLLSLSLVNLSSCSSAKSAYDEIIYVLNAEDYIDESLLGAFEDEVLERDGKKIKVVYETYDTNETMYNTLKTGKQNYDIVCCSDYMIQRLVREGMAKSFMPALNEGLLDNYKNLVSPFLASYSGNNEAKLNKIDVNVPIYDENGSIKDFETGHYLNEYAIGYMWGTLGIIYNPELILKNNNASFNSNEATKDLSKEERIQYIIDDMSSLNGWDSLWNPLYKGNASIKDSMRDTYAVGIMKHYKDYFDPNSSLYIKDFDARNEQFNKCDDETIKAVQEELIKLKDNIFGFEVDSGKDDIVTQKVGINIAWSGDAVNSIGRGYFADEDFEEVRPEDKQVNLYYSIPKLGANVWFDAWFLPTHEDSYYETDQYKYAMEFLDFLNDPENAVANMSYNGYTTFMGSDSDDSSVLSYALDSYDLSDGIDEEDFSQYDSYDLSYYFPFEATSEPLIIEAGEGEDARTFEFSDENGDGYYDIIVHTDLNAYEGRALIAQYPQTSDVDSLYVMKDFGNKNNDIVQMWENVKVNPLPAWVVVTLLVFLFGIIGYFGSYKLIRKYKLKKRKELRKEEN